MRTSITVVALLAVLAPSSYAAAAPGALPGQEMTQRPSSPSGSVAPSTAGQVVWTNRATDGSESLWIADADGTHERPLTHAAAGVVHIDAQFSPDGAWVAYEADHDDTAEIRLVRSDGSADHRLPVACAEPCLALASPTWMSERRLAFSRVLGPIVNDAATEALLWTVNVDGTSLRRLSPASAAGRYEDSYAHVSRNGRYLTWMRVRLSDGETTIMRSDADGSHRARLLPWGLGVEVNDLSTAKTGPTKDLVIFEAYGRGDPDATFVDLGTVPATCPSPKACRQALVWLTDNAASGRRNANPHWSPAGRDYVFTDRASIDTEDVQIWTAHFGDDERRAISTSKRFDYRPDWGLG